MNIEENSKFWENYQKQAWTTCLPSCQNFEYLALGLVNEAGEVAGKIKKKIRGDYDGLDTQFVQDVKGEVSDCLWYLFGLFTLADMPLRIVDASEYFVDTTPVVSVLRDSSIGLCRRSDNIAHLFCLPNPVRYLSTLEIEVTDVVAKLHSICTVLGFTLEEAAEYNLAKLAKRYATNKIIGSGDNR